MNRTTDVEPRVRWVVGATIALGAGSLLVHLLAGGEWEAHDLRSFFAIATALALAQRFLIPLRHRTETGTFDVSDAALAAGLMLAKPGPLLLAVAVGVTLGQGVGRVAPSKIAFNTGQHLIGMSLAALVFGWMATPGVVDHRAWLAMLVAMALYFVVNESAVDLVISLVERVSFRSVLFPSLGFSAAAWAVNLVIGLLTVQLWKSDPWSAPLIIAPLVLAHLAYRSWLQVRREREQIQELTRAAETISLETDLGKRMPETDETPALASLAATLDRMLTRLEGAFHRERRFIRDASHELRTPVTITRGYLEVLPPDPSPEELKEAMDVALDELDRMGRLITDLTTLAKVDDPEFVLSGQIRIGPFLERIAAKTRPILGGRLRIGPHPATGIIAADEQRLTQGILNLLQNAVIHGMGNEPVELRVATEANAWRVEICDFGGGLPPEAEDAIFQPFHRLDGSRPGSGLGLAITKGIAEAHGGSVGVDNRPGEGATFWIRIPR